MGRKTRDKYVETTGVIQEGPWETWRYGSSGISHPLLRQRESHYLQAVS